MRLFCKFKAFKKNLEIFQTHILKFFLLSIKTIYKTCSRRKQWNDKNNHNDWGYRKDKTEDDEIKYGKRRILKKRIWKAKVDLLAISKYKHYQQYNIWFFYIIILLFWTWKVNLNCIMVLFHDNIKRRLC